MLRGGFSEISYKDAVYRCSEIQFLDIAVTGGSRGDMRMSTRVYGGEFFRRRAGGVYVKSMFIGSGEASAVVEFY